MATRVKVPNPRQLHHLPAPLRWGVQLYSLGARVLATFGNLLSTALTQTGFDSARWNRLTSEWTVWRRSADQEVMQDLGVLRARSRNLVMNNPYARRFVSQVKSNVAGPTGFRMKALARMRSGDLDETSNDAIGAAWDAWCRKGICTVDGRQSFGNFVKLLTSTLPMDGEVLVRLVDGFANPFRFAVQAIDADLLDDQLSRDGDPAHGVNEIRMGVEIDQWGRPLAYHMFKRHPSEVALARVRIRVPADELIHLYIPFRTGQSRGVPWFHAIMMDLKQLDGYQEAEIVAARMAASAMGFIETTDDAGFQPTDDERVERLELEMEPGLMRQLPPGTKFTGWAPDHPTTAYKDFVKGVLRSTAAGLDMAYHNLAQDLEGVNYSSSRTGELDERDHWLDLQQWVIDELLQPIYERWLRMAMLSGALQLKSEDPDLFCDVRWMPRGWPWVDPLKDLQATELAVSLGLTTRTREAAAMGLDFDEMLEELADEEAKAKDLGVEVGGLAKLKAMAPGLPDQNPTQDTAGANPDGEGDGSKSLESAFVRVFKRLGVGNGHRGG